MARKDRAPQEPAPAAGRSTTHEMLRTLALLDAGSPVFGLFGRLLYGAGMRIIEGVRLRMKENIPLRDALWQADREVQLAEGGRTAICAGSKHMATASGAR